LDNGLRSVDDPELAHRICGRLGAGHVRDLLTRMTAVIPDPLTPVDRQAGFKWSFSVAQLELSDTAVFDEPRQGRAPGSRPQSAAVHYKSSKVKAYLKEGRALRVEATINNPADFDLHKTLNTVNWRARLQLIPSLLRPASAPAQRVHRTHPGTNTYRVPTQGLRSLRSSPTSPAASSSPPHRPDRSDQAPAAGNPAPHHRLARLPERAQPPPPHHPTSRMTKLASRTTKNCVKGV